MLSAYQHLDRDVPNNWIRKFVETRIDVRSGNCRWPKLPPLVVPPPPSGSGSLVGTGMETMIATRLGCGDKLPEGMAMDWADLPSVAALSVVSAGDELMRRCPYRWLWPETVVGGVPPNEWLEMGVPDKVSAVPLSWVEHMVDAWLVVADLVDLWQGVEVKWGFGLAGSHHIPADADLLLGHVLADVKNARKPQWKKWVLQQIIYVLHNGVTPEEDGCPNYEIDEIGFLIPNRNHFEVAPISDWLARLGCDEPIEDLIDTWSLHVTEADNTGWYSVI